MVILVLHFYPGVIVGCTLMVWWVNGYIGSIFSSWCYCWLHFDGVVGKWSYWFYIFILVLLLVVL